MSCDHSLKLLYNHNINNDNNNKNNIALHHVVKLSGAVFLLMLWLLCDDKVDDIWDDGKRIENLAIVITNDFSICLEGLMNTTQTPVKVAFWMQSIITALSHQPQWAWKPWGFFNTLIWLQHAGFLGLATGTCYSRTCPPPDFISCT
jgi:hypothetical protein